MSLKRICAAVALATLFASCTHVGTKVGNLSKGGFTTVVVDAGHGGKDNGGTSGRGSIPFQREKDLTLDTAKRVRELLRRSGFRVVMMREGDYFVELDERVARANKEAAMRSWSAFITTRPLTPQKMAQKPISGGLIVTDSRLGSNRIW